MMNARIIPICNSKGIRLPKRLLVKYGFEETVTIKEMENGILLEKDGIGKLSWTETYHAIASSDEDWSDGADLDLEDMG